VNKKVSVCAANSPRLPSDNDAECGEQKVTDPRAPQVAYFSRRGGVDLIPANLIAQQLREGGDVGVLERRAVFASIYIHTIVTSRAAAVIPSALLAQSKESVGAALIGARRLAQSNLHASNLLVTAAHTAVFDGFRVGCLVAAGAALASALLVVVALPARPTPSVDAELAELIRADRP
jgi:hypothetical protein